MSKETTITLDLANLDRNETWRVFNIISADEEHADENVDAITNHVMNNIFRWIWEARKEKDFDQIDYYEALLPADYYDEGVTYDAIGWRYDENDWSVTTRSGEVFFNEAGWLDADPARWDLVEDAARILSKDGATQEVSDIATALGVLTRNLAPKADERPNAGWWAAYIAEYAAYNYDNGERVDA